MNNYELHHKAQELEDTHSAYQLARMVLTQKDYIAQLEANLDKIRERVNESN